MTCAQNLASRGVDGGAMIRPNCVQAVLRAHIQAGLVFGETGRALKLRRIGAAGGSAGMPCDLGVSVLCVNQAVRRPDTVEARLRTDAEVHAERGADWTALAAEILAARH